MESAVTLDTKRCRGSCGLRKPLSEFHADGRFPYCKPCSCERATEWYRANRERAVARKRRHRADLKEQVFDHYGRACACCGSVDRLTIDHIVGDGAEHRAELSATTQHRGGKIEILYPWLIHNGFPEGFQTLCRPCNTSKANGEKCRIRHVAEARLPPATRP